MKAQFGKVEVEGTPAEIAELLRSMQSQPSIATIEPARSASARKYVDEDTAYKVLKRRPLSKEQVAVLKTIKANQPGWTSAIDLQRATKYSPAQLAGLLGAFGRRVTGTPGYRQGSWWFDQEWNYEQDCNRYRFPDSVLAAVSRAGL